MYCNQYYPDRIQQYTLLEMGSMSINYKYTSGKGGALLSSEAKIDSGALYTQGTL